MSESVRAGWRRHAAAGLLGWLLCASLPVAAADFEGTLAWARRVELGIPVAGVVAEVLVSDGERVAAGQPLLRLDRRPFAARLAQQRARLEQLVPAADEAQRELERAQELYDRTLLSDHELELARIAVARITAERHALEAEVELARIAYEQAELRAPFAALVVRRLAQPGLVVVNGLQATPLLVLADSEALLARAYVGEEALSGLRTGASVAVSVAGQGLSGEILHLGLEPEESDALTTGYRVDVRLPAGSAAGLRAGLRAVLQLP
ncbi:MAG TPA: efflux RND transporter periplasmic adaptor subunit [Gammaproteobacteria bacterium]